MSKRQTAMFRSSVQSMLTSLRRFMRDQCGATSIEYALIAASLL